MYTAFLALNEDKQKKIINGAMKEFVKKGYRDASTNEIVANAGISKGSLFHYFGSKKQLAEFLIRYSLDTFAERIVADIENMTDDIIERWREITLLKLALIVEHPLIFEFALRILKEDGDDIHHFLQDSQRQFIAEFNQKIYVGIDYSKFKEDVDIGKALKLIYWGLEGYAREIQGQVGGSGFSDELLQQALRESGLYLDLLKKAFYK